ncbi:MAG: hypothetical protein LHW61_05595 [Candidatus Cloacimonetes bacterium]|jgi:hypothetical protein|nr:hypothetical protein [Candidatus Cloacimonadota bacterium]
MNTENKQVETMTADEKFAAIANLKNSLEENFISLGELLSEIKRSKLFRKKGYDNFKDFIEAEYSLSATLAGKLVKIFDLFIDDMDVDETTVKEIGYDRLQMIYPMVNKSDWDIKDEWLTIAQEKPANELRKYIQELKANEKEEKIDQKKILVDQYLERMTSIFNCSRTELDYKLALYFQDMEPDQIKKVVQKRQRQFESELKKEEST